MAFTKLTSDVAINQSMPDRPNADGGLTAAQMKEVLDRAAVIIKTYLNTTLIQELEGTTGAQNIGAPALTAESGTTVAAQLAYILAQIQGVTQGGVADGSITMAKLAAAVSALVSREIQFYVKEAAGSYTFTPAIDGNYLVLLVGAGSGTNGVKGGGSTYQQSAFGYAGGVAIKLCALTANTAYTVTVGAGGAGGAVPAQVGGINYGGDGGDTSIAVGGVAIFTATGGKNSTTTPGSGSGADIILPASTPARVYCGGAVSDYAYYPSKNPFSKALVDTSDIGKWGATGVMRTANSNLAGITGGDGAAVILYLG